MQGERAIEPAARPYAWEASYPPGARWDEPVERFTLPDMLARAAAAYGANPAIEYRGRRISFAELAARADRLAVGLIGLGLRPGDPVGLYLPNTPYHPIAFFAALRAGLRVVHLTPLDPVRALARKLADSGARTVIANDNPALLPNALRLLEEGAADRLIVGSEAALDGGPAFAPASPGTFDLDALGASLPERWPEIAPDDVAVLQYTGGTTGTPKGAMLTHANLAAAVSIYESWSRALGRDIGPGDRIIGVLPLFHIYALTGVLLRSLRAGAEILLRPRFDAAATLHDIETLRATVFLGVPTMWIALAAIPDIDRRDLSSLRHVGSGGAPLPTEVADRFEALTGHRLGGGWGMTETSPCGTNLLPGAKNRPGLIGLPLPGIYMDVVALDDPQRILPPGETGEIRIRGPNVTQGYWNRPEENARAFAGGFFLTGDVGYMEPDGQFFLVDRRKDMIISGGFNVYPRVIEDAIYEHPDVAEAAVIGIPDPYRGQAAKAFVALRQGAAELTLAALREFLAERIGRHEMPAALELRDSLPRTPVGKISRRDLADDEGTIRSA